MRNQRVIILGLALVLVSASACTTPRFGTFPDALRSCRLLVPGHTLQKSRLPATHPLVSACLERHGWTADGPRSEVAPARR